MANTLTLKILFNRPTSTILQKPTEQIPTGDVPSNDTYTGNWVLAIIPVSILILIIIMVLFIIKKSEFKKCISFILSYLTFLRMNLSLWRRLFKSCHFYKEMIIQTRLVENRFL